MYPKVFADYAKHLREHGPVDVLPTPVFFYGMTPGQEIAVDLEPGKTLVIRCQAVGEADEEGHVKVFFELNGQPRIARVLHREAAAMAPRRAKADESNPDHVAAPMPGMVASVAVTQGQMIRSGDLLLTIEAMKMETTIHAQRDGRVAEVVTPAGTQVDAKDLLVRFGT